MKKQEPLQITELEKASVIQILERRVYSQFVEQLREEIQQFLKIYEKKTLIIDLSNVNMINSAGIGVFISVQHSMQKQQGQLILVGLNKFLGEIFQRMRLDLIFEIKKDVEEALKSIK